MSIKFYKIDITSTLDIEDSRDILLNPALCHWKKNLFLCAYRVFVRYKDINTSQYKNDPLFNPNHPWLGGEGSTTWWKSTHDQTRIVLLRINGKKVSIVNKYGDFPGVDFRMIKLEDNKFSLTGNLYVHDANIKRKDDQDCSNGCVLIISRVLTIDEKKGITISRGTILCPRYSEKIEKNWTMWKDPKGNMLVSYAVAPNHEVFHLTLKNNKLECPNIEKYKGENPIFPKLRDYYSGVWPQYPNTGSISASTPALPLSTGNYIALGHFKYQHHNIENINHDSNLYKFNILLKEKSKNFHPSYVYLMFFYEFNPKPPYNIIRISNMFIPDSKFSLVFATNLTYFPDQKKYIVSYGDHDSECWLLFMTEEEIMATLQDFTDPEDVQFLLIK
jgi:hypothetical protein